MRYLLTTVVLALALTAAACGSGGHATAGVPTIAQARVALTAWGHDTESRIDASRERFLRLDPHRASDEEIAAAYADLWGEYRNALATFQALRWPPEVRRAADDFATALGDEAAAVGLIPQDGDLDPLVAARRTRAGRAMVLALALGMEPTP